VSADIIPLAVRLRERRRELGLSQAQAARELEVARTAYRLWEMQAARPAPDRWRVIAKWLGVSVSAMLLAAELIDEQDSLDVERAALGAGITGAQWDEQSDAAEGDFFAQERSMIDRQAEAGTLTPQEAAGLHTIVGRIQDATLSDYGRWHPGRFRKRFPNTTHTPALARAALAATAVGIPAAPFDDALLLISELVTNSVRHSESDWIDVAITVETDRLRIEVSDQSTRPIRPRTRAEDNAGGWGLALVAQLATRWGVEREDTGKTIWVEFDLSP
jgi:transcriptional regulator with XRE-family HTH domain/anti-sigma regulatory factor (Ser/Thr protein kinase)